VPVSLRPPNDVNLFGSTRRCHRPQISVFPNDSIRRRSSLRSANTALVLVACGPISLERPHSYESRPTA